MSYCLYEKMKKLLLSHEPDNAYKLKTLAIFMLSGKIKSVLKRRTVVINISVIQYLNSVQFQNIMSTEAILGIKRSDESAYCPSEMSEFLWTQSENYIIYIKSAISL